MRDIILPSYELRDPLALSAACRSCGRPFVVVQITSLCSKRTKPSSIASIGLRGPLPTIIARCSDHIDGETVG